MIRDARAGDLVAFLDLCGRFRDRLDSYPGVEPDRQALSATFGQCLTSALGVAFVSERDGALDGVLLGVAQPLWWARAREATDLMFFCERPGDGYRMLRRFVEWARSVPNVRVVTMAQSSGMDPERTTEMYNRAGLGTVGMVTQVTL